jgi:glycosyltransferase involved in cell wall biosynthesis
MPDVSIIIVSHNKPQFVTEAVRSVLAQTHQNWQGILIDSGVLLGKGFFNDLRDPRLEIIASGETPEIARTKNMASWCFNKLINEGRIRGELLMYLCDDDVLYPNAFAAFWNYFIEHQREPQAMYAAQDIAVVDAAGHTKIIGRREADRPAGKFCKGRRLDSEVDYLQFCHATAILDALRKKYRTSEIHSEDKRHSYHADGIFMERVGSLATVHPIHVVTSMNRRTASSINIRESATTAGRLRDFLVAKSRGLRDRILPQY